MTEAKTVRIGGASGAWGDSPGAIEQLLEANVQYFMMDYLAEVTMSLLARARMKDPDAGYPPDFVGYTKRYLKQIAEKGIKIASNGGGVNPIAAKKALEAAIAEAGLSLKVAVVEGDDVIPLTDALREEGLKEYVSGAPLPKRLLTANAYLGALPVKAAFDGGADIVITGRCADSALALGILMHEFGWAPAASSATSWNAARRQPVAIIPTGTQCRTGTTLATPSPKSRAMAASSCPSPKAPAD
jgi:hypothetical protein